MFNRLNNSRRRDAHQVRQEANELANSRPQPDHLNNGDEEDYRNPSGKLSYIGNFSKGLPHNNFGEVNADAYRILVRAIYSTDPIQFERPGIMGTLNGINLVNPQAGLAFDLEGADAQAVTIPPAPRMDSAETAAEMAELYWMALLRDVHFKNYDPAAPDPLVTNAVRSLNTFSEFKGPKQGGVVTPETLFRGIGHGNLAGPYVSQFLLKPIPYGSLTIEQLNRVAKRGQDYLTKFPEWLKVQNGVDRRIL